MKHVLLVGVNAKYIHSNLAIRCLKAVCERQGIPSHIDLCEYTINQSVDSILYDIVRRDPDIVGFSCYIFNIDVVKKLAASLRKLLPDCTIILGGPEVGYRAAEALEQIPAADYIIRGEGEHPIARLLNCLEHGDDLCAVPSLTFRQNQNIVETPQVSLPAQDTLPFCYTEQDIAALEHKILYFESSRGCPFRCSYCISSIEKQLRFFSMDGVLKQLQLFLDNRVQQVKFIDRTFNCSPERALAIWEYIRLHDNGVTNFHFEIAADLLNEAMFRCLEQMRPGLVQLEIGVQSTSSATLSAIRRKTDWEKVRSNTLHLLKQGNIHIHLDLIAGLPAEDYQSFTRSFNDVYSLHPHQFQLGFLKVLYGSALEEHARTYGIQYRDYPPYEVLSTNAISYPELIKLKRVEALVDALYNSGRFRRCLALAEPLFQNPYAFYDAFADYLEQRGISAETAGKYGLYQALLDFAVQREPSVNSSLRQAIKFDLYSRERMRILPDFLGLHSTKQNDEPTKKLLSALPQDSSPSNCHIEFFPLPGEEKPAVICFDYSKRDLWGNASIIRLS
ncbi:MAG: B12-binding domain-containing radical SAM protein [Oscillospiraceae bacterium]|jgi:radical SAM superfamily enzyme YgiQ (UPF0313 family)